MGSRIFMLGATGTIGRATVQALSGRGHQVVCFVRPGRAGAKALTGMAGVVVREGNPLLLESLRADGLRGEPFDAWVSCLASRTGVPADAWLVDYDAHRQALTACREVGVRQAVLLSALCVQRPLLEFQRAKLAFESELVASGLTYSIVRPTAFFKSLSGQFERVRSGKSFLLFGDGALTSCKPISDHDLGQFLADCVDDARLQGRVLPVGGPGPALTPLEQGLRLFEVLGKTPRFTRVPVGLLDMVVKSLDLAGRVWPAAAAKAQLARIGRYYATESMLVWDPVTQRYSDVATPEYGSRTLTDHYQAMARGEVGDQRGEHAVF